MHSAPTRVALAGSILVLGSVGTVTAVQLQSAPAPLGKTSGTPLALSPAPTAPHTAAPSSPDAGQALAPTPDDESARRTHDVPLSAKELVNLGTAPLSGHAVRVAADDAGRGVRDSVRRVADDVESVDADDEDDDAYPESSIVRRVVVRGGQRQVDDEMSEQAQRELARRMIARFSQSPPPSRPVPARRVQTRGWAASSAHARGSQRISDPFRASQAGYGGSGGRQVSAANFAGRQPSAADYVGRHRA